MFDPSLFLSPLFENVNNISCHPICLSIKTYYWSKNYDVQSCRAKWHFVSTISIQTSTAFVILAQSEKNISAIVVGKINQDTYDDLKVKMVVQSVSLKR